MEDLAEKINSVLQDPQSLKQLGELAQMLGFPPPANGEESPKDNGNASPIGGGPDISALMSLAGRIREAGGDDDNINFLLALRPLLSDEKKPRIDRAVKILRLINILPALKDSGILGGDFLGVL